MAALRAMISTAAVTINGRGFKDLSDYRTKLAGWLNDAAKSLSQPKSGAERKSRFVDLAPTDKADPSGIYSDALTEATDNPRVLNIAITGPYGSGKSSIIQSFLKKYQRPALQISLAAFLPDAASKSSEVSRQEIERSILQQMLYGADANRLPLSRFKRIQTPGKWAVAVSLYIMLGIISLSHLMQNRAEIMNGAFFLPLDASNWFNFASILLGGSFLWLSLHHIYVASFGISLKSVSLKDIEITPKAATEESILNRHLDEIIYFFQSTKYDLVVIEDLDRFENADIFVTLREINSLVNANSGVRRTIRFLYALRDDIFVNTDRTKFFEFIIPVIPIINSSNSIDKVLEQGQRLEIDRRLDPQFLREVSRYLNDLRLIQNIFNEYAIYIANLATDGDNALDETKLLAVLIYKNVFPSDFESLHRGKGRLAEILGRYDAFVAKAEAACKAQIASLEEQLVLGQRQLPNDLEELRRSYAMAILESIPEGYIYVGLDRHNLTPIQALAQHAEFDKFVVAGQIFIRHPQGHPQNHDISGIQTKADPHKSYQQRKLEIANKSAEFVDATAKTIRGLREKLPTLRMIKFNEIIRNNADGVEELFMAFGENAELARFLVFEGFLDDTYYQYTSLFHSGRLSPNDNNYLRRIRGYKNPDPDFQIDNPKEVIAAMRDEDFRQDYVLNTKIVDSLLADCTAFGPQTAGLFGYLAANFAKSAPFFAIYYARGVAVPELIAGLVKAWPEFVQAATASTTDLAHIARIISHLPAQELSTLTKKHPALSGFVSVNLPRILAEGVDFEPERLKVLQIESPDLASLDGYHAIVRVLVDAGLYELSVRNLDFILRTELGIDDEGRLHKQHYSSVLAAGNDRLEQRIDAGFADYLNNVLLELPDNSEETVAAMIAIVSREELDPDNVKAFLQMQSERLPSLDQVPAHLHPMLFEIQRIEASWENCRAFLSSETYDAEILTAYLSEDEIVASLSQLPVSGDDNVFPLRDFLIGNDTLDDEAYAVYVRVLPKQFKAFPEGLGTGKLRIVIDEQKITFSSDTFSALDDDSDLQTLFIAKNIKRYFEIEDQCPLEDDLREGLLRSDITDDQKVRIIGAMDLALLTAMPTRAAIVGRILARTACNIDQIDAEAAKALIVHSTPVDVQVLLLNKFRSKLDKQQVGDILLSLPEPFSDIKPGWGIPRIESSEQNLELVAWLKNRGIISSWRRGGLFDDDIRINLFRK